jgi:ankyrin repeat protein
MMSSSLSSLLKAPTRTPDSGRHAAALHAAAYYGHGHLMPLLLAHGADTNGSAGDFATPLKTACAPRFDNTNVVTALLDAGADIDAEGEPQGIFGG